MASNRDRKPIDRTNFVSVRQKSKGSRKSTHPSGPPAVGSEARVPASHGTSPCPRWHTAGICLGLIVAVWVVYGQALRFDFINLDDGAYVYENPNILAGLNFKGVQWAFTHIHSGNWHPLTTLTHMLDCQLFGKNPAGHHLGNVVLHSINAVLLLLVLRLLTGALWPSTLVAALFALHPLRVESVAWVSERKDVLSGLFFMLTVGAYGQYVRRAHGTNPPGTVQPLARWRFLSSGTYWLALFCFALGLLSKPMLVTLPCVLLLLDYWPLARWNFPGRQASTVAVEAGPGGADFRWLLVEKIPFLMLSLVSCWATVIAQRQAIESALQLAVPWRISNTVVAYATYVGQMFYPANLAIFYPHPENHLSGGIIVLSLAVLLAISATAWRWRQRSPFFLMGWLWYLGMLVPVIGLIQVGGQAHADRYTYLPQIGLYLALAWGLRQLSAPWRNRRVLLGVATAVVLAGSTYAAYCQTRYWRDSIALWTHAVASTSKNDMAHNNLGSALFVAGQTEAAVEQHEQALRYRPYEPRYHFKLGVALSKQGKTAAAMLHFRETLRVKPDHADAHNNLGAALAEAGKFDESVPHYNEALRLDPNQSDANNNLGAALVSLGRPQEALAQFERALQLNPHSLNARNNLGRIFSNLGRPEEAVQQFNLALQQDPNSAETRNHLGAALAELGKFEAALDQYRLALQLNPRFSDAEVNLGKVLSKLGKVEEAIQHYERALELKPDNVAALFNLGNRLLAKGKLELAVQRYVQALGLQPEYAEAHNNLGLALRKLGKPAEARPHFQKAAELADAEGKTGLAESIRAQLKSP